MPSATSRRRSRSVYEGQDDQSSDSEPGKRQRLDQNEDEDSKDEIRDDSEEDPFQTPAPPIRSKKPSRRQQKDSSSANGHGNTDFQPGAIVRVLVNNFVTYEQAEFLPGPSLNMVIGPNGTGKSSLVCAIALGLGYKPHVLGRASEVKEFVKHGKDAATIEIELQKRPSDSVNPVIRVQITREDNRSKWWLNGQETTRKNVESLTRSLRIQVDNLCQFLPQDKVAEFAGLTPVQLLHETLKAAAPEQMINWQSELRVFHQNCKEVKMMLESCTETLKAHENRQQGLQADVDRMNDREAIKKKIDDWENARACAEYNTARAQHKVAVKRKKEAEKRLNDLEKASGPALEAVNRKMDYQAKLEAVVLERKDALKGVEATAAEGLKAVEAQDDVLQHIQNKKNAEFSSAKTKRDELNKVRRTIANLEAKRRDNEPPPFNAGEWNQKIREQDHILRESARQKRELSDQIQELRKQGQRSGEDKTAIEQNLKSLDSQEGQQLSFLKRNFPEIAKGWDWLRENQDKFEKEVFGPPMLSCSLKDERYSNLIQSLLQNDDFTCFTAQTKNDHKKLSAQFYGLMGLSVSIRTCAWEFESFRPPMSAHEARRFGLDGFAIDYMEGPKPVLAMLCSEKKLHASGVALKEITGDQFDELVNGQKIAIWSTGQTNYRVIRRREYGPDATTTSTRKVREGRYWTNQPIDNGEKTALQEALEVKKRERDDLAKQYQEKKAKLGELQDKDEEVMKRADDLRRRKSELQAAWSQWQGLPDKIALEKDNEKVVANGIKEWRTRMANLEAQLDEALVEKARAVLCHKDMVSEIRNAHQVLLDVEIRLIEAKSDVKGLKERNTGIMQRLTDKKDEITNYTAEADMARREAVKAKTKVERIASDEYGGHDIQHYEAIVAGKTLEEIDNEIGAEKQKLDLIHGVDPSVLRQFEKRAQEIETLMKQKVDHAAKLERIESQKEDLMSRWEPKLNELVSRINDAFSYNFEQISCAGEVSVHKDDDFDQWAIVIKVKFRENETLQQLNQHRQSGGERAVSTIFYLMALQSMAQAPFRVVDEINQGMDPRNERMVHERMVEIACREHTSQYFLITPKLLTGLRYDERMRVLCIASGEHMPEDGRKLDFGRLIAMQRALKAAAAAA